MTDDNFDYDSGQGGSDNSESFNGFAIPEEYANKGWAKTFSGKSGDELVSEFFKSYDNSQALISKRVEDYIDKADLSQLENFETLKEKFGSKYSDVPDKAEDYALNEILKDENGELKYQFSDDVLSGFSEKFKELGLSKEQGQKLLEYYTNFEVKQFSEATSPEGLEAQKKELFKGDDALLKTCNNLIDEFISDNDKQYLKTYAPNQTLMMFYKMAKGITEKYDYKEGNSGADNSGFKVLTADQKKEQYNKYYDELVALEKRPHTPQERQDILDKMNKVFL